LIRYKDKQIALISGRYQHLRRVVNELKLFRAFSRKPINIVEKHPISI
jgi:hypothetical protein